MGNLILCHDRHAAHPYEITRIHCRIFTIEEFKHDKIVRIFKK